MVQPLVLPVIHYQSRSAGRNAELGEGRVLKTRAVAGAVVGRARRTATRFSRRCARWGLPRQRRHPLKLFPDAVAVMRSVSNQVL